MLTWRLLKPPPERSAPLNHAGDIENNEQFSLQSPRRKRMHTSAKSTSFAGKNYNFDTVVQVSLRDNAPELSLRRFPPAVSRNIHSTPIPTIQ